MARVKTPHIVVTFSSTDEAMALEDMARSRGIPGRMIPVPSDISAGCGLCWSVPVDEAEHLTASLDQAGLSYAGIHVVELY